MDNMKRQTNKQTNKTQQQQKTVDNHILQVGSVRYATGEEQRSITNSLRKNEVAGQKQ